jgi:hypothetical protein
MGTRTKMIQIKHNSRQQGKTVDFFKTVETFLHNQGVVTVVVNDGEKELLLKHMKKTFGNLLQTKPLENGLVLLLK